MRFDLALLVVEDFPRMLAFYGETLGLARGDDDPGAGYEVGVDWAQFTTDGGGLIEVFDHRVHGKRLTFPLPRTNAVALAFRVDDLARTVETLRARGVVFTSVVDEEWGAAAHFDDPEGNALQLYQVK